MWQEKRAETDIKRTRKSGETGRKRKKEKKPRGMENEKERIKVEIAQIYKQLIYKTIRSLIMKFVEK